MSDVGESAAGRRNFPGAYPARFQIEIGQQREDNEEYMSIVDWDPPSARAETVVSLTGNIIPTVPLASGQPQRLPPVKAAKSAADAELDLNAEYGDEDLEDEDLDAELDELDEADDDADDAKTLIVVRPLENRPLHRMAEVREQQGFTLRNMARRLGSDVKTVRAQENVYNDLRLSELYTWQRVLEVPVADLLVEDFAPLSAPVMQRAQLVRLMKTAVAIQEKADTNSLRRMVQMLIEQLQEIMPELKEVGPWHTVGQRRTLDDYGRTAEQPVSEDVFRRGEY